jgi:hypothetical protein
VVLRSASALITDVSAASASGVDPSAADGSQNPASTMAMIDNATTHRSRQ